ncbi:MAG: cobalamin biosynthesis protein CbiG [Desulfobacteraceae bacterium]|nr:MAG: cobalamin biosynthesis protein CbiG [Desulfobacteraceae bacterium]
MNPQMSKKSIDDPQITQIHADLKKKDEKQGIAIWALTPGGAALTGRITAGLADVQTPIQVFLSGRVDSGSLPAVSFERLSEALKDRFHQFSGHIFVMAAGVVVRAIAPLILDKTRDPAVVVVDEAGRHVVSLLSGHIGGANRLAIQTAEAIGADPVITTATDVNRLPAIDDLAIQHGLSIENPQAIKGVHMALLHGEKAACHDPFELISGKISGWIRHDPEVFRPANGNPENASPGIFVSDEAKPLPPNVLILRPKSLVAGIGCNRNTPMAEIEAHLREVFKRFGYAPSSLALLATADVKADEEGLLELAEHLNLAIEFYDKRRLNAVDGVPNPSPTVEKHVGVKSVCEAAAILASKGGQLIVPKQVSRNVTLAIARRSFIS